MRLVGALVLLLGLAMPAVAAEEAVCTSVTIDHSEFSPRVSDVDWVDGAPRYVVVGRFVWFDYSDVPGGSSGGSDTVSVDVSDPDVVTATGCSDGSITIDREAPVDDAPVSEGDPEIGEPLVIESMVPVCERNPVTLRYYCSLSNTVLILE